MVLTGMKGIVIGICPLRVFLIHLTILLAASAGGLSIFNDNSDDYCSDYRNCGIVIHWDDGCIWDDWIFCRRASERFGKLGIAVGGCSCFCSFFMYDLTLPIDSTHFYTIGVATMIFLLIPTKKLKPLRKYFFQRMWITQRKDRSGFLND